MYYLGCTNFLTVYYPDYILAEKSALTTNGIRTPTKREDCFPHPFMLKTRNGNLALSRAFHSQLSQVQTDMP